MIFVLASLRWTKVHLSTIYSLMHCNNKPVHVRVQHKVWYMSRMTYKFHNVSPRPSFVRSLWAVDWGRTSDTQHATVSCWNTWSRKSFTGCIRIWPLERWSSATRAIMWKPSGGTRGLTGRPSVVFSCLMRDNYSAVFDTFQCFFSCLQVRPSYQIHPC